MVKLVDLAILVLGYDVEAEDTSLPLPVSCELASGSLIQSIVTCSGFLKRGCYAILPLAFNHWDLSAGKARSLSMLSAEAAGGAHSRPCVLSLHSSKKVNYQQAAMTRPGFLAESIFLLAGRTQTKFTVSLNCRVDQTPPPPPPFKLR